MRDERIQDETQRVVLFAGPAWFAARIASVRIVGKQRLLGERCIGAHPATYRKPP